MSSLIQFTVELSRLFPVKEGLDALTTILKHARDLRKSGSDILVENDLAHIFGRGKVNEAVKADFKRLVLHSTCILPLIRDDEIHLACGAGPTVNHAIQSTDRAYLSSVIQLSMLLAFHNRAEFAAALTECIAKRHRLGYPDANPDPGFEGIESTLHAISAQTNAFPWNSLVDEVESKLRVAHPRYGGFPYDRDTLMQLAPNTLFAAMDMLCTIQSLPDDRKMLVKNQQGLITVVIWAHYLLSLTVTIKGLDHGDLTFGDYSTAHVIIEWDPLVFMRRGTEVLLLDSKMEILFQIEPDTVHTDNFTTETRHTLRNFGTEWLRRRCNSFVSTEHGDPLYHEIANYATAMACHIAERLPAGPVYDSKNTLSRFLRKPPPMIERWEVTSAAELIFEDVKVNLSTVNNSCERGANCRTLSEFPQPGVLSVYLGRVREQQRAAALESLELRGLVMFVILVANLADTKESAEALLTVTLRPIANLRVFNELWEGKRALEDSEIWSEWTPFELFADLLIGTGSDNVDVRTYVLSECGWSLALDVMGDKDPADVQPWRLHLRRGVPTSSVTGERRYLVLDLDHLDNPKVPVRTIFDRGQTFVPRCITHVHQRMSFITMRSRAFSVKLRLQVREDTEATMIQSRQSLLEAGSDIWITTGYRELHDALWKVTVTPPCQHSGRVERLKLGAEVATTNCLDWKEEGEISDESSPVPEKVCVLLVKGDRWARWLAVNEAVENKQRKVILRRRDTCENCAIDLAVASQGKWLVII